MKNTKKFLRFFIHDLLNFAIICTRLFRFSYSNLSDVKKEEKKKILYTRSLHFVIFCTRSYRFDYPNLNDIKHKRKRRKTWREIAAKKGERR